MLSLFLISFVFEDWGTTNVSNPVVFYQLLQNHNIEVKSWLRQFEQTHVHIVRVRTSVHKLSRSVLKSCDDRLGHEEHTFYTQILRIIFEGTRIEGHLVALY